jgi:hypothetical protein
MPNTAIRRATVERAMKPRRLRLAFLLLACSLTACVGAIRPSPEERLANAEEEMKACKGRHELNAVPTPSDPVLYNPSKSPTFSPEGVDQLRIKALCGLELQELLDAQRDLKAQPR